jgi:DNA-binding MarR family transcriptional regulator
LSTQVATWETVWVRLLRVHASLARDLNASLVARHGITLSDYEALLRLSHAPGRRLRRVDLAGQVFLSPSGVTRMLDGLERNGLVCRGECPGDRRVVYAQLTDEGEAVLRTAADDHLHDVRALLEERLDPDEVAQLDRLLAKLPGGDDAAGSCSGADTCAPS